MTNIPIPISGPITINKRYTLPDTAGSPGQGLFMPASGIVMEWGNSMPVRANLTQLISGNVVWLQDLDFAVTTCVYYIRGILYSSAPTLVTLTAADAVNPRIDVIYVDTSGLVGFITGTPAADPAKPLVDPLTQLELTSVYINTNATEPSDIVDTIVYDENVEWTFEDVAVNGSIYDLANTTDPYKNTYCLRITDGLNPGDAFTGTFSFTDTTTSVVSGSLIFYIKTTGLLTNSTFEIGINDGTNSASVAITNTNNYGIVFSSTAWQRVVIPFSDFNLILNNIITVKVKYDLLLNGARTVYFDRISIQTGVTNITTYTHPQYTPISFVSTGDAVVDSLVTDNIGSVVSFTTRNITIPVQYWKRTGTTLSPVTANDLLMVTSTAASASISGIGTIGTGVYGVSDSAAAVQGISASGNGIYAITTSGIAGRLSANPSSTNTSVALLQLERLSSGSATHNIGGYISFKNQTTTGVSRESGRMINILTVATNTAEVSSFEWWLCNSGTLAKKMELTGGGNLLVTSAASGYAIRGTSSTGTGVAGTNSIIGVEGSGSTTGGSFSGSTTGLSATSANIPIWIVDTNTSLNTTHRSVLIHRSAGGGASIGFGSIVQWQMPNAAGSSIIAGEMTNKFTAVVAGTETTSFEWWLLSNNTFAKKMELTGAGNLIVNIPVTGNSILGENTAGIGIQGKATSGYGIFGVATTGIGGVFQITSTANNTATEVIKLLKYSSGTASNGIGSYISWFIKNSVGTAINAGRIVNTLTSVTSTAESASFQFWLSSSGSISNRMSILHDGTLNTLRGKYNYQSQTLGVDTAGDWRTYSDANGFYHDYCTVGAATLGGGTWVMKHTINI